MSWICSCFGLADQGVESPTTDHREFRLQQYDIVSRKGIRGGGSRPWQPPTPEYDSRQSESLHRPSTFSEDSLTWPARHKRPSTPGSATPEFSVSSQESPGLATPSLTDSPAMTRRTSKPFSPPALDCSSSVIVLSSGAQDLTPSTELGALAQRRGFKGSPIIVEPMVKPSIDASSEAGPLSSKSLKAKFGNLLRPIPSPLPTSPLSPMFSPLLDDVHQSLWDSDPFSVHGESFFSPNTPVEIPNVSRSTMYDLNFYQVLSAKQDRHNNNKIRVSVLGKQDKVSTVNIYDSSIYDFGIQAAATSTPVKSKKPRRKSKRKQHERSYSTSAVPSKSSVIQDLPTDPDPSDRPIWKGGYAGNIRRYCLVMSNSETTGWEVEALA